MITASLPTLLKQLGLLLLSAALVWLSAPPTEWTYLAAVAWVPFFVALRSVTPRQGFYLGLTHGLLCFGATLSWFFNIFGTTAVAFWGILALFSAVFGWLLGRVGSGNKRSWPWAIAVTWTGFEYFRGELSPLSFPWITPGVNFEPGWLTSVVGTYGVTFVLVLFQAKLAQLCWSESRSWKDLAVVGLVALCFLPAPDPGSNPEKALVVALVQFEDVGEDTMLAESRPLLEKADILLWPEHALGEFSGDHQVLRPIFEKRVRLFVTGGTTTSLEGRIRNSGFTFQEGKLVHQHIKNHTVHFFAEGEKGTEAQAVDTVCGKIGTPVCFDCDHQDVVRRMTQDGAEFFLIPSLDAISWGETQHLQHARLFRHRAVENGRWLAVAATSGVTQVIDPAGRSDRFPVMEEGTVVKTIYPTEYRTLYTRGGWLFGPVAFGLTVVLIVLSFFPKFRSLLRTDRPRQR